MGLDTGVVLVVNCAIGEKITAGPGREAYDVARDLHAKGLLGRIYCLSVAGGVDLPAVKVTAFSGSWLIKQVLGIISRIHRRMPVIRGRRRIEQWMDASFARHLKLEDGGLVYCPKPLYPKLVRRAKALGMTVVLETSVLHPRFNLDMVSAEKRRLGLSGASGYTDAVRVSNIEQALQDCDRIFAWSDFLKDSYIEYGVPAEKFISDIEFSPPGIDTGRFIPGTRAKDEFTVLHVSAMSVIKGVHFLLDAWQQVCDRVDGTLVLVGPADRDMRTILESRELTRVEWIGRVANPLEQYRQASVFVSPSISDAGPRTVLEAMACETPTIVSDHCGVSSIIRQDENGMTYAYDDVEALAQKILWCSEHRDALRAMGSRARETVKDFSLESYSNNIETRLIAIAGAID